MLVKGSVLFFLLPINGNMREKINLCVSLRGVAVPNCDIARWVGKPNTILRSNNGMGLKGVFLIGV